MAWRRRDDFENPAWPGMVDIFAFTLALFMIFWFAGDFPAKLETLEKKTRELAEKMRLLDSKNVHLNDSNRSLGLKLESLTRTNQNLSAQLDSLQDANRGLEAQNKLLTSGNTALNEQVARLDEENILLRDIGRKDWGELLKVLQQKLAGLPVKIIPHEREKEIEIQGNPRITFETMKYDLSDFDQARLEQLAPILRDLRQSRKFFITINGTADPRELQRELLPRNNTELSALRAATVGAVLEDTAPGLGQNLRILGLGSKGLAKPLAPADNPDQAYREYRTVSLVLKIDVASLLQDDRPGQKR